MLYKTPYIKWLKSTLISTSLALLLPTLIYAQNIKQNNIPQAPASQKQSLEALLNKSTPNLNGFLLPDRKPFDLRSNVNRVTMLVFWGFDCATCISRLKELRANAAGWNNQAFDLVIISTDKLDKPINTYISYLNISLNSNNPKKSEPNSVKFMWRNDPKHVDLFIQLKPELFNDPNAVRIFLIDKKSIIRKIYTENLKPSDWDDVAELVL